MGMKRLLEINEPADSREGKLTLLAILMMLYIVAMFFSVAIHEVLGHGLFTVLLGGEFYAFYLSPGSGFASLWFPPTLSRMGAALIYMAGILVQLVIGALVLFLVLPRIKNVMVGLFTLMFCVSMLVYSSLYLVMGYIYSSGDTLLAVRVLGVNPEPFLVAGIILTGTFVLIISTSAINFLGRLMNLEDERSRMKMLSIFWMPSILLHGIFSMVFSATLSGNEFIYSFLNSALLLMFIGLAIFLVPAMLEPERERDYRIPMKSVFAVVICFVLLLACWTGAFGVSRESAHGIMIHNPPIEAEIYYADYTIGNFEITVYLNGTVRADVTLRNRMENPSSLEDQLYHSFDLRPDWNRYVARSRNILITMFNLPRTVGENLTFSTGYETIRALDTEDELGRKSTTYFCLADIGTRQSHLTPGDQSFQPGMGIPLSDITLSFIDPWYSTQGGYMDEVRVSWESGLEEVEILAWNQFNESIPYNLGSIQENWIGWKNINVEGSPSNYKINFKYI
jgi:hypothetical protein